MCGGASPRPNPGNLPEAPGESCFVTLIIWRETFGPKVTPALPRNGPRWFCTPTGCSFGKGPCARGRTANFWPEGDPSLPRNGPRGFLVRPDRLIWSVLVLFHPPPWAQGFSCTPRPADLVCAGPVSSTSLLFRLRAVSLINPKEDQRGLTLQGGAAT